MNLFDYITSSISIIIDKTSDYIKYNIYNDNKNQKVDKKRIFPLIPYLTQLGWFYDEPTHIIDNIYLGSAFNASHYKTLKDRNIGMIINMTPEISNYFENDYIYYRYPLYDDNSQSIKNYLIEAYDKIIEFQLNKAVSLIGSPVAKVVIGDAIVTYGAVTLKAGDPTVLVVTPAGTNGQSGTDEVTRDFILPAGSIKTYEGVENPAVGFTLKVVD
jgi:hypothetical protein